MKKERKEYRKFLTHFVSFGVFFYLMISFIEFGIAELVSQSNNSQTGKINLMFSHQLDPNIMVFGSSVAEVAINTNLLEEVTENSVYNSAIDGTNIIRSEFLIDEFLSYSKKCKKIVIGLSYFSMNESIEMTSSERFLAHASNNNVKNNIKKIAPKLYKKLYYMPFYSFIVANHIYYKNAVLGFKNLINNNEIKIDSLKGFRPYDAVYSDTRKSVNLNRIEISQSSITSYRNIINKITKKGIEPILIIMPMHINGRSSFSNYNEFIDSIKELGTTLNVKVIDYTDNEIIYSEENFYNNGHLNSLGAERITKIIGNNIKN
ncbi:hypothetical protein [uncultured Polaribacter sp.]|uniref:hypothetical protein n=1 Tax=uncultured Polaribacter sp. TaxID=174711 RepID=UPI002615B1BB|nr:hypothetical protein [uncultured Polaribacter sp.]